MATQYTIWDDSSGVTGKFKCVGAWSLLYYNRLEEWAGLRSLSLEEQFPRQFTLKMADFKKFKTDDSDGSTRKE